MPYNFNPAKIFLGDTGSLFIGYVFATVSILITAKVAVTVSLLVPLVALALPVVDTAAAIGAARAPGRRSPKRTAATSTTSWSFASDSTSQAVLLIYASRSCSARPPYCFGAAAHLRTI